jgi:hypothetical protein
MFYFRVKVPVDLQRHYLNREGKPRQELTKSLKTADRRLAEERFKVEDLKQDQEFQALRRKADTSLRSTLSDVEIERLAALQLYSLMEEDEASRINGSGDGDVFADAARRLQIAGARASFSEAQASARFGMSARDFQKTSETLEIVEDTYKEALARGDISVIEDEADDLLSRNGLSLDKDSDAYRKMAYAILKAHATSLDLMKKRHQGEVINTPPEPVPFINSIAPATGDDPSFSCLWHKYKDERKLPTKTAGDFGTYVRRFIEVNGDMPVKAITKAHVRDFKDAMLQLPSRMNKKWLAMTVPQLLEETKGKTDILILPSIL